MGSGQMRNFHADAVRFYVADGPLASTISEASEHCFRECRTAAAGCVRVDLPDGTTELITGTRYLEPGTLVSRVTFGDYVGP